MSAIILYYANFDFCDVWIVPNRSKQQECGDTVWQRQESGGRIISVLLAENKVGGAVQL